MDTQKPRHHDERHAEEERIHIRTLSVHEEAYAC